MFLSLHLWSACDEVILPSGMILLSFAAVEFLRTIFDALSQQLD